MERASQEEQNGVNFSSVAPSSEELWTRKGVAHPIEIYWYMYKIMYRILLYCHAYYSGSFVFTCAYIV